MSENVKFIGIYLNPGEGIVAALKIQQETRLFDKQGLEWRIVENKRNGIDTSVEEQTLKQMKATYDG